MSESSGRTTPSAPTIARIAGRRQLLVDGEPFLIRGGELHNSSGSSPSAIAAGLDRLTALQANTALVPLSWELIEPQEGEFDFALPAALLAAARQRDLKVIPLWFGTWKNGRSSYAPGWVKTDPARFPRAVLSDGSRIEHVSPFSEEAARSDAAAFSELMRFFAEEDPAGSTVVMAQVENEVGLLGDSRDRSDIARSAFESPVPAEVVDVLLSDADLAVRPLWEARGSRTAGSWSELLGDDLRTDEFFMAWAYASFVQRVADAGRGRHDIPLLVNAWLDSDVDLPGAELTGGRRPGIYPSGGPVLSTASLWRALAPSVDVLSPDIYVGDFSSICRRFAHANDGALLIPEMRRDQVGAAQILLAVGGHRAMAVSPFGVDSGDPAELAAVADVYRLLRAAASPISHAERMDAFHLTDAASEQEIVVGRRRFSATLTRPSSDATVERGGYGLVVQLAEDDFLAVGRGFQLEPVAAPGESIGILQVDELIPVADGLVPGRRLNGDETMAGGAWVHPARGHMAPGALPIAAEGANSGVTRCRLYAF